MDNQKRFEEVSEKISKLVTCDDYIINFNSYDEALTRFADNMTTQNIERKSEKIYLTTYFDGKKAMLSTKDFSNESLKNFVHKCETIAKSSMRDPEYLPSASNIDQDISHVVDSEIANMTATDRAEIVKYAIENSIANNIKAFGTVSTTLSSIGIRTKNGANKFYSQTTLKYKNTLDKDGEKCANSSSVTVKKDLDHKKIYDSTLSDLKLLGKRRVLAPGKYKAVISSSALSDLISMGIFYGMDRRSADEGRSAFTNKLGTKIASKHVNISTNAINHLAPAIPFSSYALPNTERTLIKNGVLESLPTSRYWAHKNNLIPWEIPNIIMDGLNKTDEDLIKQVDKGFYIKEFWYIRMVNPTDMTLTGMTRNGFYYIENGKIISGANHFRWNDSPIRVLNNIIDLGKSQLCDSFGIPTLMPSVLVDDFYLSSNTKF